MLLPKLMQVFGLLRHGPILLLTWSLTRKIEQRTFKALLLDNNTMIQYAHDEEGLQAWRNVDCAARRSSVVARKKWDKER